MYATAIPAEILLAVQRLPKDWKDPIKKFKENNEIMTITLWDDGWESIE